MGHHNVLTEAVKLLDDAIDALERVNASKSSDRSLRTLSIRFKRLRSLLKSEIKQSEPSWHIFSALMREAGRMLAKVLVDIDNFPYKFRPVVLGYGRQTWA